MPIVKPKTIHNGVYGFLTYIGNAHKTKNKTLKAGFNIPTNAAEAYDAFRETYTYFSKTNDFDNQKISYERNEKGHLIEKGKASLFHYVQSFDPKDNDKITPEEVNAFGVEWAKRTFGKDFQYIVSTHVDKNHIHNHIALCPYSLTGKKWNENMKTLNFCRKMSDQIAEERGISVIKNPQSKNNGKRKEWEARQNGTSWKKNLCDKLDALILKDDINTLEDIQRELQNEGYYVRLGKYMTIKPPDKTRSIRTENLDRIYGGYSMNELEYRLKHKNKEISLSAISQLSGMEKYYAIYMRSLQITVFKTNGKQYKNKTYRNLVKTADLLTYITLNHVRSENDLKRLEEERNAEYNELKSTKRSIEKRIKKLGENESEDSKQQINELQGEIEILNNSIAVAEKNLYEAERFYQQYCDEYKTDDYTKALEEYKQLNEILISKSERNYYNQSKEEVDDNERL